MTEELIRELTEEISEDIACKFQEDIPSRSMRRIYYTIERELNQLKKEKFVSFSIDSLTNTLDVDITVSVKENGTLSIRTEISTQEKDLYYCTNCPYKTQFSSLFSKHDCTKPKIKKHKCGTCDYSSDRKYDLARHKKLKHDFNVTWFKCKECSAKFKQNYQLKTHLTKEHGIVNEERTLVLDI